MSNNSMDVRAKQLLCLERRPLNFSGLGGGFARQFNRWAAIGRIGRTDRKTAHLKHPLKHNHRRNEHEREEFIRATWRRLRHCSSG